MCKILSLVPSKKTVTREDWDKLNVYFSIFEWYNWSKHQFCPILGLNHNKVNETQADPLIPAENFISRRCYQNGTVQYEWHKG